LENSKKTKKFIFFLIKMVILSLWVKFYNKNIEIMYRINETLSSEENLRRAKEFSETASEYIERFDELCKSANKFVPVSILETPSKRKKLESLQEVYNRLVSARWAYNTTKATYESRERMEREKLEAIKVKEMKTQLEESRIIDTNEAIKFCLENGRTFGDGLSVENAIVIANDIAFDNEVKRRNKEIGDDFIDFDGQNCEDECAGWNPSDRRCQCGNRRVDWTDGYNSNFRNMHIYAQAY
jgi:hypothetical protein